MGCFPFCLFFPSLSFLFFFSFLFSYESLQYGGVRCFYMVAAMGITAQVPLIEAETLFLCVCFLFSLSFPPFKAWKRFV
jgi:hypothetical protein